MDSGYDYELTINPGETPAVRAHVTNDALTDFTQASLSTITYDLIRLSDESYIRTAQSVTISSAVFDTLQTWPNDGNAPDDDGYNFLHRPAASDLSTGGDAYEARYTFTDTNSRVSKIRVKINTNSVP